MDNFKKKLAKLLNTAKKSDNVSGVDKRLVHKLSGKRVPSLKQLAHLPRFLSAKELLIVRILLAIGFTSLFVAGISAFSSHIVTVPAPGGEYVEASVGSPRLVNPVLAYENDADLDLVTLIYSGLMKETVDGKLAVDLASEYRISEDGKIYTFKIRDNAYWHDNEPVKASDVVATFGFIKNPAWKSPYISRFKNVEVTAVDEKTVQFTLTEPFAPFLSYLKIGIMPEHLWSGVKPENVSRAEYNIKPTGSGPFRYKGLGKDEKGAIHSYSLTRNDSFYGNVPHLASITIKYYSSFMEATDALLKRRVDGISYLPSEYVSEVDKLRTVNLHQINVPQYTAVFFNQEKNELLKNEELRLVLAKAIDRDALLAATGRAGTIVNSPVMPWQDGFRSDLTPTPFDTTAAITSLDELGWQLDEDGYRYKGKGDSRKQLAIALTTIDTKENITVTQFIAAAWEKIGIRSTVEITPPARFQADKLRGRNYEALVYGEITGQDPDLHPFWHSSQVGETGLNLALWKNSKADELMVKSRAALTQDDRNAAQNEIQGLIAEDLPAIFLYSPTYIHAVSRRFGGIETKILDQPAGRLANIADWYVETKRTWVKNPDETTPVVEAEPTPEVAPADETANQEESSTTTDDEKTTSDSE